MKSLTLFIFTLWVVSMFVLAAETKENNQNNLQDQKNTEKKVNTEKDTEHDVEDCDWTDCTDNPLCPWGTTLVSIKKCGNLGISKSAYCCEPRPHRPDGDDK